jgi:hypothetical protein
MNNHNKDSKDQNEDEKRILQVIHDNPAIAKKWAELLSLKNLKCLERKTDLLKMAF